MGAVCIDAEGNVASGVSSGGMWVKMPGRIGEAAVYAAGCWAESIEGEESEEKEWNRVGCSVTGVGEVIMRDLTASCFCEQVLHKTPPSCSSSSSSCSGSPMHKYFQDFTSDEMRSTPSATRQPKRDLGIIGISGCSRDSHLLKVMYGHSTPSMGVGWMACCNDSPQTLISRKEEHEKFLTKELRL